MSHYIHHVPGRLRVKSPALKRNEWQARQTKDYIDRMQGVLASEINPVTGSLLIKYDANQIAAQTLLNSLRTLGHVHPHHGLPEATVGQADPAQKIYDTVVNKLVETVIERSATALIAAII